jgi:hypothetical protein
MPFVWGGRVALQGAVSKMIERGGWRNEQARMAQVWAPYGGS